MRWRQWKQWVDTAGLYTGERSMMRCILESLHRKDWNVKWITEIGARNLEQYSKYGLLRASEKLTLRVLNCLDGMEWEHQNK